MTHPGLQFAAQHLPSPIVWHNTEVTSNHSFRAVIFDYGRVLSFPLPGAGQSAYRWIFNFRHLLTLILSLSSLSLLAYPQQISKDLPLEAPAAGSMPADKPFVDWARMNAIPLKTVEAGNGFADMQPIGKIVGNARVVALGEATHGTREFFQLKHRMLEYLATQNGFTIFTIEANMPEAYRLNDFVLHGQGDPKQLLRGMYFWTWDTQEVLDMILWMREFNRSGKGHIEFTGFDMQFPNVPIETVKEFVRQHDPTYLSTVEENYRGALALSGTSGPSFGVATATFPVQLAAGKHIKFSGYIRTENIKKGYAGLWWRVDGEPGTEPLAFDNMYDRGAAGTTDWKYYEISLNVPANARNINFGVLHPGDGSAWFDSLKVEVDGVPYTDTSVFDLDFESPFPRGFYTGGIGYQVAIDPTVAHTGKQSLLSTAARSSVDATVVRRDCESVLQHLELGRSRFIKTARLEDVDWAIQNARIVFQFAQLSGGKTRDESMAENIKWITDHNPGARIVVWAHNGHVARGGTPGYEPMGSYLRKMFGKEFVNFGFAFNEGSFRAVEMGKGLREFTVAPPADGTLDHALAATGLPIFALNLRKLPKEGPVADWISHPHPSRSIGAVYSEANASSIMWDVRAQDAFDAILFVEKTSAARGNSGTILK